MNPDDPTNAIDVDVQREHLLAAIESVRGYLLERVAYSADGDRDPSGEVFQRLAVEWVVQNALASPEATAATCIVLADVVTGLAVVLADNDDRARELIGNALEALRRLYDEGIPLPDA